MLSAADVGTEVALPGVVGVDRLAGAVGVVDAQLRDQREAGRRTSRDPTCRPCRPTNRRRARRRRRWRRRDLVGHVVGLGLDALVVVGPAGREELVADLLAVELQLVDAVGRRVDAGDSTVLPGRSRTPCAAAACWRPACAAGRPCGPDAQAVGVTVPPLNGLPAEKSVSSRTSPFSRVDLHGLESAVWSVPRWRSPGGSRRTLGERGVGALVDMRAVEPGRDGAAVDRDGQAVRAVEQLADGDARDGLLSSSV